MSLLVYINAGCTQCFWSRVETFYAWANVYPWVSQDLSNLKSIKLNCFLFCFFKEFGKFLGFFMCNVRASMNYRWLLYGQWVYWVHFYSLNEARRAVYWYIITHMLTSLKILEFLMLYIKVCSEETHFVTKLPLSLLLVYV